MFDHFHEKIRCYFCSKRSAELNQVIFAFTTGLLLGPFSTSILFKFIFIIIYEIIIFYFTQGLEPYWRWLARIAINCAGLYGYFLGRWLMTNRTGLERIVRQS